MLFTPIDKIFIKGNCYERKISSELVFEDLGQTFMKDIVWSLIKFIAGAFAELDDYCLEDYDKFYISLGEARYYNYAITCLKEYPAAKAFFEKYPEFWPELIREKILVKVQQ